MSLTMDGPLSLMEAIDGWREVIRVDYKSYIFLGVTLLTTALFLWRKWLRDLRAMYPAYNEIPATILSHMPSKKELQSLDKSVDVVVSYHSQFWEIYLNCF